MNLTNPVTLALWSAMAPAAAWGVWEIRRSNPRTWEVRWHDGDDPTERTCSGIDSVRGIGFVYEMYNAADECEYVGQALIPRERFTDHAQNYKSATWHRGVIRRCGWRHMNERETERIAALRPRWNKTRGGSQKVTARQAFAAWRRDRAWHRRQTERQP